MVFIMSSTPRKDNNLSSLFPKGTYNTFTNDQFFKQQLLPYSYWPMFVMNVAEITPCYSETKEQDCRCSKSTHDPITSNSNHFKEAFLYVISASTIRTRA